MSYLPNPVPRQFRHHPLALAVATALNTGIALAGGAPTLDLPSLSPTINAVNAARDSNVAMQFTDVASLTFGQNFMVRGHQTARYSGVFTGNDSATIAFNPTALFKPGERIQLSYTGFSGTVWEFIAAVGGGSGLFVDSGEALGNGTTQSVALGDVDNDGDLDLVDGNRGQPNQVWLNNGAGHFTDSGQPLGSNYTYSVALGDVDDDGDLDLVEGNYGQANRVWLNDGLGMFSDSGQVLGGNTTRSVVLGDVDGDGDLDLVEGNYGEASRVWLNDGAGHFTDSGQSLGSNTTVSMALGDVDGDGDLDGVAGNDSNQANRVW
ncbi:MAG: VCBS repeat-containing protein, partial [Candidatus Competibacteraceae bacterium]|nr:VCBS repeat-containing protein [Candidatus Competibacteraceae bacterium]